MNKLLKSLLTAGAALVALLVVGVAIIVATFNPESYKALLIERVQQDWQRPLAIPGEVALSLFPKIGVKIGEVSLSERGGPAPFASAVSANVSLAVWPLLLKAQGQATALLDKQSLDATLGGTVDASTFDARIGMTRFTPAAYSFDIKIDRLDLDRITAGAAPAPAAAGAAAETPLDLSALGALDAQGNVKVGALKVAGMQIANLRAGLRAAGGRVDVDPVAPDLYEGRLVGSIALDARAARHQRRTGHPQRESPAWRQLR